jgi:hypothetical protein
MPASSNSQQPAASSQQPESKGTGESKNKAAIYWALG